MKTQKSLRSDRQRKGDTFQIWARMYPFVTMAYSIYLHWHCVPKNTLCYPFALLPLTVHSYPLAFLLIKNWPRCVTHVLMVSGHPWARGKYQPNQTIPVFGLFGLQSWVTSRHVCGHVTCATCNLRAPVDSPWVVDDVRHWNFSICY